MSTTNKHDLAGIINETLAVGDNEKLIKNQNSKSLFKFIGQKKLKNLLKSNF